MTKRIRTVLAGLTLATAALAGLTLAVDTSTTPPDTTWGAHVDQDDTTWGTAPVDLVEDATRPVVTPLDTTWG